VATEFKIPNLGENVKGGDVLHILVRVGDSVAKDQGVLELETDKATIEVPASEAGTVTAITVKEGDKVKVGQTVLLLDAATATLDAAVDAAVDATIDAAVDGGLKQEVPGPVRVPATDKRGELEDDDTIEEARRPARVGRAEVVDISRGARTTPAVAA
jgi:pyruvate dehydrogenase E2 component (dihydrolipoamide acetyltransferase)